MQSYLTVEAHAQAEFIEKKSRFIGSICPVDTESHAIEFIEKIRAEHFKASHNCYAYVLRQNNILRYSDDGEPQGTAGIPMLEVLKRENILDAVVVVTRYFGGTLLGAGGLVRAYSHSAKIALNAAKIITMCECTDLALEIAYPQYEQILKLIEKYPAIVLDTSFADTVTLYVRIKADSYEGLRAELTEFSAGKIETLITGELFTQI